MSLHLFAVIIATLTNIKKAKSIMGFLACAGLGRARTSKPA